MERTDIKKVSNALLSMQRHSWEQGVAMQAFVENAIVHGFERKKEEGYVKITGRKKDEMLEFVIEDDGYSF